MFDDKRILAFIPARGGSKGIPHKNIMDLFDSKLIFNHIYGSAEKNINNDIKKIDEVDNINNNIKLNIKNIDNNITYNEKENENKTGYVFKEVEIGRAHV